MKFLPAVMTALGAACLTLSLTQTAQAQFRTPTVDGVISGGEYDNQYRSPSGPAADQDPNLTWRITWNNSDLFIAISDARLAEGAVVYLDLDPQTIVNAPGSGTSQGLPQSYEGSTGTLPFQADAILFIRSDYREVRTFNRETNQWRDAVIYPGQYAQVGTDARDQPRVREFSIPWATINGAAGRPANFNWLGYIAFPGGGAYGQVPIANPKGIIGTSANFVRYFTVLNTAVGSASNAFGPNGLDSYSHSGPNENTFGAINVYDFTLNTAGGFITRAGDGSAWNIQGNLRVGNGTLNLGNSVAAVQVAGDLTFTDPAAFTSGNAPIILNGNGNQTISGDTYSSLTIQGTGVKTITSDLTITQSLIINNGTLATGPNTVILGSTGRLSESATGYLLGRVSALTPTPLASEGASSDFGGIGLRLTQRQPQGQGQSAFLNTVSAVRITGFPGTLQGGSDLKRTISRRYSINANLNNNPGNRSYEVAMDFAYRRSPIDELGGNDPSLLELYQSESASNFNGTYSKVNGVAYNRNTTNVVGATGSLRLDGAFFSLADGATPLPVELISFAGKAENNAVRLTWATASEKQNKGFDIEHRSDQSEWSKIGFVAGNGTTNQRNNYSYIDRAASAGNNYYRLRQVDLDGKSVYSQPVTVQVGAIAFSLSPVPTTDVLTLHGLSAGRHVAEIYNARGQRVLSQPLQDAAAATLSVRTLPVGVYMVRVLGPNRSTHTARFIKQ
ncbi:T9SS type A sorting domain-containing protein [Hymenobacter radiodurans]|uniref:T9SS type A sorting domain-containing protein n=1 Tax=Hymenobacter radiodurans TaxID=2496028 RepID=UPI00105867BA|nr:T9SS type A sorting domain-containing protein [Hymenobacter radiodurans]